MRGQCNGFLCHLDRRVLFSRALQDASTQHQDLWIVGRQGQRPLGFLVGLGKAVGEIKCASPQVMVVGGFGLGDEVQHLAGLAGCKIGQTKLVTNLDIVRADPAGG